MSTRYNAEWGCKRGSVRASGGVVEGLTDMRVHDIYESRFVFHGWQGTATRPSQITYERGRTITEMEEGERERKAGQTKREERKKAESGDPALCPKNGCDPGVFRRQDLSVYNSALAASWVGQRAFDDDHDDEQTTRNRIHSGRSLRLFMG